MKRIAFVNQRYGLEVNGGSEYYTRIMAEHFAGQYQVEVLTTKAKDYITWKDAYQDSIEIINNVTIRRFSVEHTRNLNQFYRVTRKTLYKKDRSYKDELSWLEKQGPYSPKLIEYIKSHESEYDIFVFVTYLYYVTCMGIREVYHKSIFVPTAHDEPYIYFNIYKDIFHKSRAIIYLTEKEKKFVEKQFMNHNVPNEVAAVGVSIPEIVDAYAFQREKGLTDYIIYVGRIDEAKGCITLFDYFTQYKKRYPGSLKLVLMGKPVLPIPEDQDIISLGFVDEEEKVKGIAGAVALVLPSQYESLSLSVLEAFSLGTPVIVNGKCEVLLDHCVKSNAGLYYEDYWEFEGCIQYMLTHKEECQIMSDNAIEYIQDNYQWKVIDEKWNRFMENIE